MNQQIQTYFKREDTKVIKGVAIVLMLMHHLWGFPDRVFFEGNSWDVLNNLNYMLYTYLASFGKICVSLFFFLGGYGVMRSYQNDRFDLIGRIKGLYISYWKMFLIFIPVAFVFFSKQPIYCADATICMRYENFSLREFVRNFLGVSQTYNNEWWFLGSYIVALVTFPLIRRLLEGHSTAVNVAQIIGWLILETHVFPSLGDSGILGVLRDNIWYETFLCQISPYVACFWMGILMAKDGLLERIKTGCLRNGLLTPMNSILILVGIFCLRTFFAGDILDIVYVPMLIIFLMNILEHIPLVRKGLYLLGKQSTNMWLIHTFFCYYFYQITRIIVISRNAIISLASLILVTYAASCLLDLFWKKVSLIRTYIHGKRCSSYDNE